MAEVAIFVLTGFGVVTEVVRFVDNNQVKILPIEITEINVPGFTCMTG